MNWTKRDRNRIYKKVLKLYNEKDPSNSRFICCLLDRVFEDEYGEYIGNYTLEYFPEFAKFEPSPDQVGMWWPENDRESRIKALKACIKQTNPKPKKK